MRPRTTFEQLSLFVLGVFAFSQAFATFAAADIVFRRHAALGLTWAVGIPAGLAIPCYLVGFRSLKLSGRPAKWPVRVVAALFLSACLLYASTFALLNAYGS